MSERDERTLERELAPEQAVIGTISFPHETIDFTDAQEYIDAVKEELPYYMTSGFAFKTLTDDAKVRKAVDDIVYDLYGEKNPYDLQYYEQGGQKKPELCLEAVKLNGMALQYVKEQTPEICMAAVQQSGRALVYVKEQTPEICMAAVQQDGRALDCVKNKTFDICAKAIASLDDVLNDEHFGEGELDEVYEYRLFAQELYDHAMQERQQANMERKKPSVMDRLQNAVKQVAERAAAAQPREQTKSRSVGHDR